jgi:predicted PurR-regulated permease PerM
MWQSALILMSGTIMGLVVVLGLQWGRPVLIPIALAVLLTFLLNPIVKTLQRRGLGRVLSVMLAVSTSGFVLMGVGWMLTQQATGLLAEMPRNTGRITAKVKTLRDLFSGPFADQFSQMVDEISQEIQRPSNGKAPAEQVGQKPARVPVEIFKESAHIRSDFMPWRSLSGYLGSAFEGLATLAFTLVLLVFFLLGREDLRDRVVLLAGQARLALTSKALEDVTERISRYIVIVALVNGGFGILLTIGMFVLQVPYALLWGFLAAGLRFLPYVGPWIGALFPITMSLATSEGWWQPLAVFVYVMALELITNNVVEPLLFRHSTGVSPTALLVSAAFWLYLWGPIGLVLSAPCAVCLVVLGKNIPQLGFLNHLLGDIPALQANVGLYQRLMLGDENEAARLVLHRMDSFPPDEVFDEMLIPALNYAKRDVQRDHLTDEDQRIVLNGMRQILLQAEGFLRKAAESTNVQPTGPPNDADDPHVRGESPPPVITPRRILGCPATDETDLLGLEMLRQILDPKHWDMEMTSLTTLTSELATRIAEDPPAIICIASLPPSGMAHARYLCKRVRDASPEIQIVVGRWGSHGNLKEERVRLEQAGATFVTATLLETRRLLESRWHLLTCDSPTAFEPAAFEPAAFEPAAFGPAVPEYLADPGLVVGAPAG